MSLVFFVIVLFVISLFPLSFTIASKGSASMNDNDVEYFNGQKS